MFGALPPACPPDPAQSIWEKHAAPFIKCSQEPASNPLEAIQRSYSGGVGQQGEYSPRGRGLDSDLSGLP